MSQLDCKSYSVSMHALKAMVQRSISVDEVLEVANNGEIIADYPKINLIQVTLC